MNPVLEVIQGELDHIQYIMDTGLKQVTDEELDRIQHRIRFLRGQLLAIQMESEPSVQGDLVLVDVFHETGERQMYSSNP